MGKAGASLFAVSYVLLVVAGHAEAQRGVDGELFHPALDSYGIFTVERSQTSHQWDWGFKKVIETDKLQAVGYGNTRPLDRGTSAAARAKNRGVELVLVGQ
jgi:hypothetical protein